MTINATLSNEDYHSDPALSKSGLWTLYNRSPFHYRFGVTKETEAMTRGSAIHAAVLEPLYFDKLYMRGPVDRRGNKWKDAQVEAQAQNRTVLIEREYDAALRLRDVMQRDPRVRLFTDGRAMIEPSGFWTDPATGIRCRCRPDAYHGPSGLIADLKTTTNAAPDKWLKRVVDNGYYVQDAMVRDGWIASGGGPVNGFLFITVEVDEPHAAQIYELAPPAVDLGRKIVARGLALYKQCLEADHWPAFGDSVITLDLPNWVYSKEQT